MALWLTWTSPQKNLPLTEDHSFTFAIDKLDKDETASRWPLRPLWPDRTGKW